MLVQFVTSKRMLHACSELHRRSQRNICQGNVAIWRDLRWQNGWARIHPWLVDWSIVIVRISVWTGLTRLITLLVRRDPGHLHGMWALWKCYSGELFVDMRRDLEKQNGSQFLRNKSIYSFSYLPISQGTYFWIRYTTHALMTQKRTELRGRAAWFEPGCMARASGFGREARQRAEGEVTLQSVFLCHLIFL